MAWVIFRGKDGRPGCVRDQCAHRACPLSLGKVEEGRIQCPYHGEVLYSLFVLTSSLCMQFLRNEVEGNLITIVKLTTRT